MKKMLLVLPMLLVLAGAAFAFGGGEESSTYARIVIDAHDHDNEGYQNVEYSSSIGYDGNEVVMGNGFETSFERVDFTQVYRVDSYSSFMGESIEIMSTQRLDAVDNDCCNSYDFLDYSSMNDGVGWGFDYDAHTEHDIADVFVRNDYSFGCFGWWC